MTANTELVKIANKLFKLFKENPNEWLSAYDVKEGTYIRKVITTALNLMCDLEILVKRKTTIMSTRLTCRPTHEYKLKDGR